MLVFFPSERDLLLKVVGLITGEHERLEEADLFFEALPFFLDLVQPLTRGEGV